MVDIIIPFYNRKRLLKRAVLSVMGQTFKDWKLWLVDDGSKESVHECLKREFKGQWPFELIRLKKNKGVSAARNTGIRKGRREWIAFLDSDDEWLPEKLETQLNYLKQNPHLSFLHSDEIWLKQGRPLSQKKKHRKAGGRQFVRSALFCCISPSAALVRRSLLEQIGLFREDFPVCEDYELWLRVTSCFPVGFIPKPLIIKHGGRADQLSRKYKCMDYWRVKALHPFLQSPFLEDNEKAAVLEILINKCHILLKGYEKHKNFKNKKEVQHILSLAENISLKSVSTGVLHN